MEPFTSSASIVVAVTTSSQAIDVPKGYETMVVFNAASDVVYLKFASSVAAPGATWTDGVMCVAGGTTQSFTMPTHGGQLALIGAAAGNVTISVGNGI